MNWQYYFNQTFIHFFCSFVTGEAINCWVCSTDTDQRCNDPMNMTKSAIEDCSRAPHSAFLKPVCKKQKQRGKDSYDGLKKIIIFTYSNNIIQGHKYCGLYMPISNSIQYYIQKCIRNMCCIVVHFLSKIKLKKTKPLFHVYYIFIYIVKNLSIWLFYGV